MNNKFGKTVATALAVLLMLAFTLTVTGVKTAPKLREITYNKSRITTHSQQRVQLNFNQQLAEETLESVTVTPVNAKNARLTAKDYKAVLNGSQITITFNKPLLADTTYDIDLQAHSAATGAQNQTTAILTTAPQTVLTLTPKPLTTQAQTQDKITEYTLTDVKPKATNWFIGVNIIEYAHAGEWVAALSQTEANQTRLIVQKSNGQERTEIPWPAANSSRSLQFSGDGAFIGLKFFNSKNENLHLYALNGINQYSGRAVTYQDGTEVAVKDWFFEPGTGSVRILNTDNQTLIAPFGGHAQPDNRTWPQTRAHLLDTNSVNAPTLELTETNTTVETPDYVTGTDTIKQPYPALPKEQILLDGSTIKAQTDSAYITAADGAENTLFKPAASSTHVTGVCMSPNQQYVAVHTQDAQSQTQIAIIELATQKHLYSLTGTQASWCTQ